MTDFWTQAGLKERYDTGELIVLKGDGINSFSKTSEAVLLQKGKQEHIALEVKQGLGKEKYIEFYTIAPGDYTLVSEKGSADFSVVARQDLSFQKEFGIFSIVVLFGILAMAWRYLKPFRSSHESPPCQ